MNKFLALILIPGLLAPLSAFAVGPAKVATLDRNLWPEKIDSPQAFDRASSAEILNFVRAMQATPLDSADQVVAFTGVNQPEMSSVGKWLSVTRQRLLAAYGEACGHCQASNRWEDLVVEAGKPVDQAHWAWQQASSAFDLRYLYEQARLAALFPRTTSEIATLDDTMELTGNELPDRHFMLSYDDGPATIHTSNGVTDNRTQTLIGDLDQAGIHAQFFLIGSQLKNVQPPRDQYRGQCVGSHGYEHKSHQHWADWANSLTETRALLAPYQPGPYWFRPPFGQVRPELLDALKQQGEKVMLWNIDSQDWNHKLSNAEVRDRVVTLMLLWRHGVILYHDIHPRALDNLPTLVQMSHDAKLDWVDCRSLAASQLGK